MAANKIDFDSMPWQSPMEGVRHKYVDQEGKRIRWVEYAKDMPQHWCEKGHVGLILDGEMEIEFDGRTIRYKAGDGIFIPNGREYRHKGKVLTNTVRIFFVEDT